MKKQILFVQGGGGGATMNGTTSSSTASGGSLGPATKSATRACRTAEPRYAAWKAALVQEIAALDDGAMLIGHSIGGTILINALAAASPNRKLGGVFLIAAPFVGARGWPSEDIKPTPELGAGLHQKTPISLSRQQGRHRAVRTCRSL